MAFPRSIDAERQLGTNHVRLSFDGEDGSVSRILLGQEQLLAFIGQLYGELEHSPLASVLLDRVRPGQTIDVKGTSIQRETDGSLKIMLIAELEDRVVTIPFTLDPNRVADLRAQIERP